MMEQRLIDANVLKTVFDELYHKNRLGTCTKLTIHNLINTAPTIDPVRHGRWVYGEDIDIQCSLCGKDALTEGDYRQVKSNYCPNCGAKMDGGEK